jgi:iron complex outermembrane receptor protein
VAAAVAAFLPEAVPAQPASGPSAQVFERVVVTGSHIAQTEFEGALPVQIITREEIERSGVTTVEQLLERVPANVNAVNAAQTIGSGDQPGLAAANLRGLGPGSTLVLLNGRRLANYAFNGEAVDLNAIPLAAIDRVEVLRDGASAIYGTDAIGGVINFILRRDYRGFDATASFDATQHGGGNSGQASVTLGAGDPDRDGYNVFGVLSYQKQQVLHGSERESTSTSYRPDLGINGLSAFTFPSNIIDRPGRRLLNPTAAGGCAPPSSLPRTYTAPLPGPGCGFDPAAVADILPEVERTSALLRGTWRLNPSLDAFAEALWARNSFHTEVAPYPQPAVSTPFGSPIYPANGPYYPTEFAAANGLAGGLLFSWRATELGSRINTTTTDAQRYVVGLEGEAAGWDVNASLVYSANQQEVEYGGSYVYQSRIIPALRSGLVNPWGPSGPEGKALLAASVYNGTPQMADGSTSQLGASASKEIAALPAGPLALALGGEARRERLSYDWDPAVLTGDSPIGSRLKAISGSRDVLALFVEANVPIAPKLDAQLAARWDDYSDFGSTTNPKVALRWQPRTELLLRGSWGEGFRAPPLYALNEPSRSSDVAAGFPDPARCPVTGTLDDCLIVVPLTTGGNPNLQPETSSQWSVGAVWEPVARLSIGVDYWSIEQDNVITTVDAAYIVANESQFPGRVIRGPVDPEYPTLPGPIVAIDGSLINIGRTQTSGIDAVIRWTSAATDAGTFSIGLQGTYVRQFDTQIDGVTTVSLLGDATNGGSPVPRWRSTLTFDWTRGPWGATLSQLYSSGYVEWMPDAATKRTVGAAASWDLQGRYNGFRNWQLAAGIRNLLDSEPPFSLTSSFQFGFNPQVSSPLGRTFYLRASYAVK